MGMFSKVKNANEEKAEFETIETGANVKKAEAEVKSEPAKVEKAPAAPQPKKEETAPKAAAKESPAAKVEEKPVKETTPKTEEKPVKEAAPKANAEEKPAKAEKAKTAPAAEKAEKPKAAPAQKKAEPVEEKAAPAEADNAEKTAYTGKFEIKKTKDDRFFFNLQASNRVYIATSQMYSSVQSAMVGIKSVINNAESAPVEDQTLKNFEPIGFPKWEIYLDKAEQFRFRLCASNGNCVCHSQGYTTKHNCKNGIQSIINSVKNAEIEKTYLIKDED